MQAFRTSTALPRLVLAWFVLALGVAVAGPIVKPQAMELICSVAGEIKLIVKTDDGAQEQPAHTLDCPLCLAAGTPPPAPVAAAEPLQPLSHAVRPLVAAHIAWLTAAPLPARGPPFLS